MGTTAALELRAALVELNDSVLSFMGQLPAALMNSLAARPDSDLYKAWIRLVDARLRAHMALLEPLRNCDLPLMEKRYGDMCASWGTGCDGCRYALTEEGDCKSHWLLDKASVVDVMRMTERVRRARSAGAEGGGK